MGLDYEREQIETHIKGAKKLRFYHRVRFFHRTWLVYKGFLCLADIPAVFQDHFDRALE